MFSATAAAAALLAACGVSVPQIVAPQLIAGLAITESGFDPLKIHDNTDGRSYTPANQEEAIRIASDLARKSHSLDLGLMQVNTGNFHWLELTIEKVFEPCTNLRAGLRVLTAISKYNTGSPVKGFANGYVREVQANTQNADLPQAPTSKATARPSKTATAAPRIEEAWEPFPPPMEPDNPAPGQFAPAQPEPRKEVDNQ